MLTDDQLLAIILLIGVTMKVVKVVSITLESFRKLQELGYLVIFVGKKQ